MADHSPTQDALDSDTDALRRRARRRLVGAIAIALVAILVVPMLFDPDPKPLGSDVDIRIPEQDSPFTPGTGAEQAPLITPEDTANAADASTVPAMPPRVAEPTPMGVSPRPLEKAPAPTEKKPAPSPVPGGKEAGQPADKSKPAQAAPAGKPDTHKDGTKGETKAEAKALPEPEPAFASRGYYLQLGAFTNKSNAQDMLNKARNAGFNASMTDSSGHYRVRVGPIPERDKALDTLARLKAKGFKPVLMGP